MSSEPSSSRATPDTARDSAGAFSGEVSTRATLALVAVCAVLLVAKLLLPKGDGLPVEHVFGIYAAIGIVGGLLTFVAARVLRGALPKPEDYYNE